MQKTGERIITLVQSVNTVALHLSGIRERSDKQRTDAGKIAASISSIEDATQQNAALVEQSTAATESLKEQANLLASAVLRFNTTTFL